MRLLYDEEALKALVSLRANADFNTVIRHIADYCEERMKHLVYTKDTAQLPTLQGYVRGYVDLVEAIQDAPDRLAARQKGHANDVAGSR